MRKEHSLARSKLISVSLLVVLAVTGCSSSTASTLSQTRTSPVDCRQIFESAVELERKGDTSQHLLDKVELMYQSCPTEYEVYTDYIEIVIGTIEQGSKVVTIGEHPKLKRHQFDSFKKIVSA